MGRRFRGPVDAEFVPTYEEVCRHPRAGLRMSARSPDFRLQAHRDLRPNRKHVQVQKPISTNLETARRMVDTAARAESCWAW